MANERQFFRNINPGDVSIEGRKSNGITAGADGSVFLYSGVKKDELDALNEQDYNGTISIDGYKGNIIAILNGNQTVPFPEGNNNNETYFDDPQIDPNKIITTSPKDNVFDPCKNKNILILGDSITAEFYKTKSGKSVRTSTWAVKFKDNQKDKNVKILAESGKQLTSWMKPELEKELKINKYDIVYIYGGVNDVLSKKTTSQIISDLQSMVDTVNNSGGQAIVITGYDGDKDIDVNKITNFTYIKTKEEYKPLIEEYVKFQSTVNTIKNALIIPKISVGVIGDGFHPNSEQHQKLYEHIISNTPKCDETPKTPPPTNQQSPPPSTEQSPPPKENKPPEPAPELEFLPEDDLLAQASAQLYDDIDFYTQVEIIDGKLFIATSGYSAKVQALYNTEKNGVNSGSKTGKEILTAAKDMVDKAIAKYPMIADKTKYPDALNRLLAMCLVAYNECRFSPINESPNHTYNTAKRASLRKVASNLTLDQFYSKFGIKPGEESKKASGDAHVSNPPAIFNYAYSDGSGNGNEASGDGYKYRGRGYYGITFKDGYKAIGKAMYGDENKFLNDPDSINNEPDATNSFLISMFEGGLCALGIGLLAYTTTPGKVGKYNVGSEVEVTLPNGTKKKIRGDKPENYTTGKGANNLVNGNDAQGYKDNFSNIYNSQELRDYINSKLK